MMPSFFRFNTAILLRAARAIQHWAEGTVALLENQGERTGSKSREKADGERGSSISSDAAIADSDGSAFPRDPAGPPAHWVELVRRHAPELLRPVEANEPHLRESGARPEPPLSGRGDRPDRPASPEEISEIPPAHRPGGVKPPVPQRPAPEAPPPEMSEVSDAALESFSSEAETKEKSDRAPALAGREAARPEEPSRAPSPSLLPSREPAGMSKPRRAPARPDPETSQSKPRRLPGREAPPPAMSGVSDAASESFSGEAETKEKSASAPALAGTEPARPERKRHAPSFLPSHRPTERGHARRPSPRSDQESVQGPPRKAMPPALPIAKAVRAAPIDFSGFQRDLPGRLDPGRPQGGKLRSDPGAVGRRERPEPPAAPGAGWPSLPDEEAPVPLSGRPGDRWPSLPEDAVTRQRRPFGEGSSEGAGRLRPSESLRDHLRQLDLEQRGMVWNGQPS